MKRNKATYYIVLILLATLPGINAYAQPEVTTKVDTRQLTVGDQLRYFIEAKPAKNERLIWATIPDTFNNLEVVEKGKIDTLNNDGIISYKQRLLITGWDSGMYVIPSFEFTSSPKQGNPYKVATDSFTIIVQTVPVDTTQPFKPIAEILEVEVTWLDYIKENKEYVISAMLLIAIIIFLIYYFSKKKANQEPAPAPPAYVETPNEKAMRMLAELEQKELWQNDQVKQYYTELTNILRTYITERFRTPAMELTSDELLTVARRNKDMTRHMEGLSTILQTADMAKFAKAQPLPQEHADAFELTKQFVQATQPTITQNSEDK